MTKLTEAEKQQIRDLCGPRQKELAEDLVRLVLSVEEARQILRARLGLPSAYDTRVTHAAVYAGLAGQMAPSEVHALDEQERVDALTATERVADRAKDDTLERSLCN